MIFFRFILICLCITTAIAGYPQGRPQRDPSNYSSVEDESELRPGENIDDKIRKNFFLRAEVSKQNCYAGEGIMAVFKAYSRLDANSQVLKRPSLSGFSVLEMVDAYNNQPDVEKYNGNFYYVHLIRKVQLFPIQAGDYEIEPAEVESVIHMRNAESKKPGIRLRDLFRRNHNDPSLQRQITFKSPEINIHVNPLPEQGQPEDFSGAVGDFSIQLKMQDTVLDQHEPAVVRLIISGTGNFPLITDPDIAWPAGMKVADPTVTEDVNKYNFPLAGMKIFQYSLDNKTAGKFTIPAVKFSYFDPSAKKYKTIESLPVNYTVTTNTGKKGFRAPQIFRERPSAPLQYYYFGTVAIVIIGVIFFLVFKKPGKRS